MTVPNLTPQMFGIETLIGTKIPCTIDNGSAGRYIEKLLQRQGFSINNGAGPDLVNLGIEIKSRKLNSTSLLSLATVPRRKLKKLSYEQSDVEFKLRNKILLYSIDDDNVIVDEEILNFDDHVIQNKLVSCYNSYRQQLKIWSTTKSEIPNAHYENGFVWEFDSQKDTCRLRCSHTKFKKLTQLSRNSHTVSLFFE